MTAQMIDHAKGLTGYNEWANAKLLKAVAEASPADLQTEIGPGAGTIAQGLRHLASAQRLTVCAKGWPLCAATFAAPVSAVRTSRPGNESPN